MIWKFIPATKHVAALSLSEHFVISHRPEQFTISYRPPGQHHHVGVGKTLEEAISLAEKYTPPIHTENCRISCVCPRDWR